MNCLRCFLLLLLFTSPCDAARKKIENQGDKSKKSGTDVPVPSDDDLDDEDDRRLAEKKVQARNDEVIQRGLSTLSGAAGSGGSTVYDHLAASTCLSLGLVPPEQAKKRVLRVSTSDPAEPTPCPQNVTSVTGSRRVVSRTGDDDNMHAVSPQLPPVPEGASEIEQVISDVPTAASPQLPPAPGGDSEIAQDSSDVPAASLYTPRLARAGCWYFFRLCKGRPLTEHHCIVANCGAKVASSSGTSNLYTHLRRKHGLSKTAVDMQAEGQCPCGQCPPGILRPHGMAPSPDPQSGAASGLASAEPAMQEPSPNDNGAPGGNSTPPAHSPIRRILLPLSLEIQRRINEQFVRRVVVRDMRPMHLCETPGFQSFVNFLAGALGATHRWHCPSHGMQARIVQADFEAMIRQMGDLLQTVPPYAITLHHDCWTDVWKRVWVCGALFFLHPQTFAPTWLLVCFHQTGVWTGLDQGTQHDPAVAATALRSSMQTDCRLSLPMWGHSDNTNPAVIISTSLGLRPTRCLAHLVVIAINRLLTPGARAHPLSPELLEAMDVLREFARFYYKKPEHVAAFKREQQRLQLPGKLPKIDGSKWQSKLDLVRRFSESKNLWTAVAASVENHPPMPTEAQMRLLDSLLVPLQVIWAVLLRIQGDGCLAASYMPLIAALRLELQELAASIPHELPANFPRLFLQELAEAEQRHLSYRLPPVRMPGAQRQYPSWESMAVFLECAALCLPQFRSGLWLDAATRHSRMQRMGQASCIWEGLVRKFSISLQIVVDFGRQCLINLILMKSHL
jgi:hypothetical protein